eukprot:GSA25T00014276001.1
MAGLSTSRCGPSAGGGSTSHMMMLDVYCATEVYSLNTRKAANLCTASGLTGSFSPLAASQSRKKATRDFLFLVVESASPMARSSSSFRSTALRSASARFDIYLMLLFYLSLAVVP